MPQGGGTRLGGEFQAGDFSVRGRRLFFQAFARLHPEAVSDLQKLAETGTDDEVDRFCERHHLWCIPWKEWLNPGEQAQHDWLRWGVRDTVRIWRASSWARAAGDWMIRRPPPMTGGTTTPGPPVEPETEYLYQLSQSLSWEPTEETEPEFKARVKTYIEHRKQECANRDGMHLAPIRRNLDTPYKWAVQFYVDGHSHKEIATKADTDIVAVQEAVRKVHEEIGLPRPKRGRRTRQR